MNDFYILSITQEKKEDYNLPMFLKDIDDYFTTYSKLDILNWIKENDSSLKQTNPEAMKIKKMVNGKIIEEKYTEIVTNRNYLTFNLEPYFNNSPSQKKNINILASRLMPFKERVVTTEFKNFISDVTRLKKLLNDELLDFLKISELTDKVVDEIKELPYNEQRILRMMVIRDVMTKEEVETLDKWDILKRQKIA